MAIAVVQWNPSKGEYQRWDALGGTFVVSPDGTIGLPVIGRLQVDDKSSAEVAARIAAELRDRAGLLSTPEVTVEIAEYPPIYIVGAVTTPGAYQFRPDLTVLQALAVAGGRYRISAERIGQEMLTLPSDLATVRADSLRLMGRIARLQAEMAGRDEILFPPELTDDPDSHLASDVVALERSVFAARTAEMTRQLTTLAELRDMYNKETKNLTAKSAASDEEIDLAQKELSGVEKLVEKGIATVSRRSELRRTVTEIKARRLDEDSQMLRAQQSLSDATRQEFGIRDQRQTAVATELQSAQADLARLRTREEALRQLLLVGRGSAQSQVPDDRSELRFTIVRQTKAGAKELAASELTPLVPGDVVKVEVDNQGSPETSRPSRISSAVDARADVLASLGRQQR
jgi:polysaccharide export outer membrane protein